jgi:hypothetical protein
MSFMDGETIRLIVVACGAIAAGLGGALIAGAFNSRNTVATIEAARVAAHEQREADSEAAQIRWLRDRKVVAYATFLAQVKEMDLLYSDMRTSPASDISRLPEIAADLTKDELMLIAPERIRNAIGVVFSGIGAMGAPFRDMAAGDERSAALEAAVGDFTIKYQNLASLMRQDLGVEEV